MTKLEKRMDDFILKDYERSVKEIDRLKAENAGLVTSYKNLHETYSELCNRNARLEAALKGLDGKGLKELLDPTIETIRVLLLWAESAWMQADYMWRSNSNMTPIENARKELARLRGLVPEAPKTISFTSS